MNYFYWELVELLRKLVLTSVLSFVSPGSGTQVTVGVLLTFGMTLCYALLQPHANESVSNMATFTQAAMFLFFLTGLLLKVKLDDTDSDGPIFNGVVQAITISVPVAPVLIKLFVENRQSKEKAERQGWAEGGAGEEGEEEE